MASTPNSKLTASVGKALLIGHLIVTLPILLIFLGALFVGIVLLGRGQAWSVLIVGFALAWLWWSFSIPRWRRWALRRGTPPDKLQRWAAITGLTWPKGWIFEKTEFKLGDNTTETLAVGESEEAAPPSRRRPLAAAVVIGIASLIGLAALLACFAFVSVLNWKPMQVKGNAMSPMIQNGDMIFINIGTRQIERGDIVVSRYPEKPAYSVILRVIGLPNETIRIDERGQIYIDNRLLEETYLPPQSDRLPEPISERTIQANAYWLMGDNRNNASDSRDWGTMTAESIYGEAIWRYWPLDRVGIIK